MHLTVTKEKRIYEILKYLNQGHVRNNINLEDWALRTQFPYTNADYYEAFNELVSKNYVERRVNQCLVISQDGETKLNELHEHFSSFFKQGWKEKLSKWFSKYWWGFAIPTIVGIIVLNVQYSSFEKDTKPKAQLDSTLFRNLSTDKNLVLKKTKEEVFKNLLTTIDFCENKYAPTSAIRYITDYISEDTIKIQNRIINNVYVDRFAAKRDLWTNEDLIHFQKVLRINTTMRIKQILEDSENQLQGPFAFSDDHIKKLKEIISEELN